MPIAPKAQSLTPASILGQLERILDSKSFARSERMKRFLRFVVEQSLAKNPLSLKEYTIALAVYDKPESFDPRIDPIVRVEASRLRAKLRDYYDGEGRDDPAGISIRKGGYSAIFKKRRGRQAHIAVATAPVIGDSEAHSLYLEGRHNWNKRNPQALAQAVDCFSRAISRDPEYAAAFAGRGDCYASQAWFESGQPGLWEDAYRDAARALELDPSLGEAMTTQACKMAVYDWNWAGAEAAFRGAIAVSPLYATARHWHGYFWLTPQRRLSAATEELTRACVLDPLSAASGTHLGCILYFRRRHREAIDQYLRAIELDPTFHQAYWHLAWVYIQLKQFDDARTALNQALELGCGEPAWLGACGYLDAVSGNKEDGYRNLERLTALSEKSYVSAVSFALVYTALEDRDAAFQSLHRAIGERSGRLIHLKLEPAFDLLKADPRFLPVLKAIGIV